MQRPARRRHARPSHPTHARRLRRRLRLDTGRTRAIGQPDQRRVPARPRRQACAAPRRPLRAGERPRPRSSDGGPSRVRASGIRGHSARGVHEGFPGRVRRPKAGRVAHEQARARPALPSLRVAVHGLRARAAAAPDDRDPHRLDDGDARRFRGRLAGDQHQAWLGGRLDQSTGRPARERRRGSSRGVQRRPRRGPEFNWWDRHGPGPAARDRVRAQLLSDLSHRATPSGRPGTARLPRHHA